MVLIAICVIVLYMKKLLNRFFDFSKTNARKAFRVIQVVNSSNLIYVYIM